MSLYPTRHCQPLLYPTYHINLSLINLSNLSLSPILNQILSHWSYTKETSQLYFQHHQHIPLPRMYQDHQHTITGYVSQPCTKSYTIPSTTTYTTIGASTMQKHLYQTMYQPCTTIVPNHASTMVINNVHQHLYHTMYQTCTTPITSTINTIPCANHAHKSCTSTPISYHIP
jgi:hypothetical protein